LDEAMSLTLSPKAALIMITSMIAFMLAQATWWVIFLAHLVNEKVDMAREYGASGETLQLIRDEEISRQIMIGLEGVFFLILILISYWLIYQSFKKSQQLKFHQQNFLMAVTHELKTPLASLSIYLDNLKSPKISDEQKIKMVVNMKDDVKRLTNLVEDILDAGRFDRSKYSLSKDTFDFSFFAKEQIEYFKKIPAAAPVTFETDLEEGIKIEGDRKAMMRSVNAILENGLKYADRKKPTIRVKLKSEDKDLLLEISDNGTGIAKEDQKHIFERFYRVGDEMVRQSGGTGLGLYLCREVIKAHGGTISVRSGGNQTGTTFSIRLKKVE